MPLLATVAPLTTVISPAAVVLATTFSCTCPSMNKVEFTLMEKYCSNWPDVDAFPAYVDVLVVPTSVHCDTLSPSLRIPNK